MQRHLERSGSTLETSVDALLNLAIESLTYSRSMRNNMAKDLGRQLGQDVAKNFSSVDMDSIIEYMSELWKRNGFGEIDRFDSGKLLLHSTPYADIVSPHTLYDRHCAFKEGMLEAVIGKMLGKEIVMREVSHSSSVDESCIFKISIGKITQS